MKEILDIHGRVRVGYELLNLSQNDVFLDVGCAWGYIEKKLVDAGMKNIYGIDVREGAIKKANKEVNDAHFTLGSATKLPFKDEVFDKVSLFDVIEHIPVGGDMTAIVEANRVLKKNGILVVTVPNKGFLNICQYTELEYYLINHRHYSEKELTSLLRKCGFDILSICICGHAVPLILIHYIRHFFAVLNKIFHTRIELDVLDRIGDRMCKSNQKLGSGYHLMIKAIKVVG